MRKLFFVLFFLLINTIVKSQTMNFSYDVYMVFECSDKTLKGYDVVTSESIEYVGIGFGKNNITIDIDKKIIRNDYFVNDEYKGCLTYNNLKNYKESDGILTFEATRLNPETNKPYTEYFIINNNLTKEEDTPYFVSYWFENGKMFGSVINKNLIY